MNTNPISIFFFLFFRGLVVLLLGNVDGAVTPFDVNDYNNINDVVVDDVDVVVVVVDDDDDDNDNDDNNNDDDVNE